MFWARIGVGALCISLTACGGVNVAPGSTETGAMQLSPGMTRDQVAKALGQPGGFISQANGVECLIYTDRDSRTSSLIMPTMTTARERLIVLKDGRLVENQLIQAGMAPNVGRLPGQETSADVCAQSAARYASAPYPAAAKRP